MFKFAGWGKFVHWISLLDGGSPATPAPPPVASFLLLRDGSSFLLLRDGASKIELGH